MHSENRDNMVPPKVRTYQTTRRHIQEHCNIHSQRHENLRRHIGGQPIIHLLCTAHSVGQYIHFPWPIPTAYSVGQYIHFPWPISTA